MLCSACTHLGMRRGLLHEALHSFRSKSLLRGFQQFLPAFRVGVATVSNCFLYRGSGSFYLLSVSELLPFLPAFCVGVPAVSTCFPCWGCHRFYLPSVSEFRQSLPAFCVGVCVVSTSFLCGSSSLLLLDLTRPGPFCMKEER